MHLGLCFKYQLYITNYYLLIIFLYLCNFNNYMNRTTEQLLSDLKAQQFLPVYLLTGEENYYIDQASDYLENNIVAEEFRDFDQTVLYGREVHMDQVIGYAKQFPMLSPRKLVLVKEAQDIDSKEWDLLAAYLEHPLEQTLLVFCFRHKKLDKRTKAYKAIASKGCVMEAAKIYDDRLPEWIAVYVNQHGFSITQKAAMLVAESLGNDLGKVSNELSKVFILIQPGEKIDESTIERHIGISKDYNIFELQSAIGMRDVVKCNRIINHFAANPKANPIQQILPNLYSYFIKIMIYHQLEDKSQAASAMKVNPYYIREYAAASQRYSLGKLASCIGYLNEADLRSKGVHNAGTVTDGELLKELVFKIIH